MDVRTDSKYLDVPEVADTRSEVTLPLRARDEIIGALSVQSGDPYAFSEEDVSVMQTLADQVAMAISNTRLFQQAQGSLDAERRAYGELSRAAWGRLLQTTAGLGFLRNVRGTSPAGDLWRPEMETALNSGETTIGGDGNQGLAIPITVAGRVIGVVDARKPDGADEWSSEDVELMETLAEQLSIALDSARLYQDTQRRAAQDRMLGEVTARLRETLDVRTVLETAVDEMYQTLGLDKVAIHLAKEPLSEEE
jgi:GAF domain-containing protein